MAAAKVVAEDHGGRIPSDYDALRSLARHRPIHGRSDSQHRLQQAVSRSWTEMCGACFRASMAGPTTIQSALGSRGTARAAGRTATGESGPDGTRRDGLLVQGAAMPDVSGAAVVRRIQDRNAGRTFHP